MKSCITCKCLVWWDGDYCCTQKMRLMCESPDGKMSKDMIVAIKMNRNCTQWEEGDEDTVKAHEDEFNELFSD